MSEVPSDNAMLASLDTVRRLDHDRFLTALLAPAQHRPKLFAIYAFNAEIARVREAVSEPMLGQIRLQWWRETLDNLGRGEATGHEVAITLSEAFSEKTLVIPALTALIDARERDLDEAPFEDMAALVAYCEATSSALIDMAARAISPADADAASQAIKSAGVAYALTGLLRALPVHASQGRLYLPLDLMRKYNVDPHDIFAGKSSDGLTAIILAVADEARRHLKLARESKGVSRTILPALLPTSHCDAYLAQMTVAGFDPFRHAVEVTAFSQQLRLLGRKILGRF
jgi:phytoene synthase